MRCTAAWPQPPGCLNFSAVTGGVPAARVRPLLLLWLCLFVESCGPCVVASHPLRVRLAGALCLSAVFWAVFVLGGGAVVKVGLRPPLWGCGILHVHLHLRVVFNARLCCFFYVAALCVVLLLLPTSLPFVPQILATFADGRNSCSAYGCFDCTVLLL